MTKQHMLWVERYRPKNIEDCILPDSIKVPFRKYVETGEVENLLLSGKPGTGKTTIAKALIESLGADLMFINASKDGNIDMLRTSVQEFASRTSFDGGRKFVIMDEADSLTMKTQESLRSFIEEYSKHCGFIFTCNYKNKIIEPLRGRLINIDFKFPVEKSPEWKVLIRQALISCKKILDENNVKYIDKALLTHITHLYPNMRAVVNILQHYSKKSDIIDEGLIAEAYKSDIGQLVTYLKDKNFSGMITWVDENQDKDFVLIESELYNHFSNRDMPKEALPSLIMHLNEYDYRNSFVVNSGLNIKAMLTNIMKDCF